jgi:hypothetical protein
VNRHPERFSCLAVRGSNFSESLLDPSQVAKYRDMKIGIFFGEHDFKVCRDESLEAVEWYRRHRFDVAARKVGGLGHERKPEVAAALFASTIGATPKTPPDLGPLVMMDVVPSRDRRSLIRRSKSDSQGQTDETDVSTPEQSAAFSPPSAPPPAPSPSNNRDSGPKPTDQPVATPQPPPSSIRVVPRRTETTPKRPGASADQEAGKAPPPPQRTRMPMVFAKHEQITLPPIPAQLRVHGDPIGEAPMWVNLSVELPDNLREGATVLWTSNDQPIPSLNGFETHAVLHEPGDHDIEAHIIIADDRKAVLRQTITVLVPASQPAS